jgi:hypothetical protein
MTKLPTINDLSTEEKICFLEMMSNTIGMGSPWDDKRYSGLCMAYVNTCWIFNISYCPFTTGREIEELLNVPWIPDSSYLFEQNWNGTRKRRRIINNTIKRLKNEL